MLIDFQENTIFIEDPLSELKPNQVSQLHFWGFTKISEDNLYKYSSETVDTVLLKLLQYLDREEISYSLSQVCTEHISELSQTIEKFGKIRLLGKDYKDGKFDFDRFHEFELFIRQQVPRRLKEHQLKAAFHLYLIRNGANFSVPGSGKTTVILSVYEKLKSEGEVNVLFVVGPPACFGPWKKEFLLTFHRDPEWRVLAGGKQAERKSEYFTPASQRSELYLTTYQTLLNDQDEVRRFFRQKGVAPFLIIDEAHYIKQLEGNWANAVLNISKDAKYRCVLTGTPFPKSYTDVYNLFDFLWPGNNPLDTHSKVKIQVQEEIGNLEPARQILNEAIGPFFYRVRKSELNLIPPIFHPPFILQMNKYERTVYDAIENRIRNYSKQDYLRNIDLVNRLRRGRMTRLRQCVSNIKLLSVAVEGYEEDVIGGEPDLKRIICQYDKLETPGKLKYLNQFVRKLMDRKQKVVIWANFVGTLKQIVKSLTQAGFYCKLIYGDTPIEQTSVDEEETRENIRDEFVDPESGLDILVANPAACGESISLHKTCYNAVYYDLSYNCAQYLQSLDRIHRVGGSEVHQAHYYHLQYEDTIDHDIKENLDTKARKMYEIIEEDYVIYSLDMFGEDDELEAYQRLFGRE
jgi:SNF2 family DNA or RNA helicase